MSQLGRLLTYSIPTVPPFIRRHHASVRFKIRLGQHPTRLELESPMFSMAGCHI